MSRANCPFQQLAFPNGKISSESFKGKMGVLETAMKIWSFFFFFFLNLLLTLPAETVSSSGLLLIVFPREANFSRVPTVS